MERLEGIGVLKHQEESEWVFPAFIIPKSNQTVHNLTDFREVNKRIIHTPFLTPKISSVLQGMEGFPFATAIDLNMRYYTMRLDSGTHKICTIILPWGKYSYMRLPVGISGAPDMFQAKMTNMMGTLEYIRTYIDDQLIITPSTFDNQIRKVKVVLDCLRVAKLRVNVKKSSFTLHEIEYLGYTLSRDGIKPQPEKVTAILALREPTSIQELHRFPRMVQYY